MHSSNQLDPNPQPAMLVRYGGSTEVGHDNYVGGRYSPGLAEDDESNGLIEYLRIIRRNKLTILVSALCGLVLGVGVGVPMKPTFRATTSLEVLSLNENFMNMKQTSQTTSNSESYDVSEELTQAKLLQGSDVLIRVFKKLDPGGVLVRTIPLAKSGWRSWFHMPEAIAMTPQEILLDKAAQTIKVLPTTRTRVLEVTVDSKDAQLAATFANTLVTEFVQQSLEARRKASQGTTEWLNQEIEDARSRLHSSESALQLYAKNSGLIFVDSGDETADISTEKLQQIQQELSTGTADRITKQSRYELAKSSPADSLADVLNDQGLQKTRAKVDDLRQQIADLSTIYNPDFSKVKRAQASLLALEEAYERSRTDLVKSINNDYHQALQREKLLVSSYEDQVRQVTGQDEKEIQYNILKREVDSNRQLYDLMLQETKQASVGSAMRASNVRVVDPALVPDTPVSPNFKLNAFLGTFAGLLMSVGWVIARERADRTLQQPGEVKMWAHLPELGTIPRAALNLRNSYGLSSAQRTTPRDRAALGPSKLEINSVELITWRQKPSMIAEAFRSALTSILFIGENGGGPKTIVFTSASPADGKTTVVSNIAIATAEIRRRTLLIDADLRRPRLHKIFEVSNESGLSDLLSGEFSMKRLIESIRETGVPGLSVLPGGAPTQSAAHLLYSANLIALLSECRKMYDMILIDTPPMLQMTDARVVARLADTVVLVARAGRTTRDSIIAVKERFAEDRIPILGTILNDWDPKQSQGGRYHYYAGAYYSAERTYTSHRHS